MTHPHNRSGGPPAPRNSVKVSILGEEYTLRSATTPEETRAVARYVDDAIQDIMHSGTVVETHKGAILACLRIAGELYAARKREEEMTGQMRALGDEIRPWLPPAKRHD